MFVLSWLTHAAEHQLKPMIHSTRINQSFSLSYLTLICFDGSNISEEIALIVY